MGSNSEHLSRREFLLLSAAALSGSVLACGRAESLVEITATAVPPPTASVLPTNAPIAPASEAADTVLYNGNLITMNSGQATAQAVALKDGLIQYVGDDRQAQTLVGDATNIVDLQSKTVTPGLIDAHNHLQVWGTLLNSYEPLIPPDVRTLDDLLARLAAAVAGAKEGEWVQGYFWDVDPVPNRHHLDTVAPNNPVWLIQQGGHYGSANSIALDIAGIDANTPDPDGGIIEQDGAGEPTGVFYNHRAMDLLRIHAPQPTTEMILNNIGFAEKMMTAVGVTSYHDCNARFRAIEAYLQAGQARDLTMRGQVFYTLEWPGDLQRALQEIQPYADDFMRFAGYKLLIDGQLPTWYTHEPHPGIRWNMPTWDPQNFRNTISQLHDSGLQISVHCGGDAAVDLVLDAYEAAMNNNPRPDPRHRIEHATLTKAASTQRAADLGVQISTQPQFLRFAQNVDEKLGPERAARMMVTREWLDAGVNVALGSDTPTSPWYKPQVTLFGAVARLGADDKPFHPEQAMTIQEALYAHTMGSARAAFEENLKGSLEPGKFADLVVWSDDFYAVEPRDLLKINADSTIINGKIL